jgi:hypothetical protein
VSEGVRVAVIAVPDSASFVSAPLRAPPDEDLTRGPREPTAAERGGLDNPELTIYREHIAMFNDRS